MPRTDTPTGEARSEHYVQSREGGSMPPAYEPFTLAAVKQSIADRFERTARLHADRVALVTASRSVTYAALDRAANVIAHAVLDRRGEVAEPVAVLMDRELPAVAAAVALAKAGKLYVPLDPSFPVRRLADVVTDCRPGLVIAGRRHQSLARSVAEGTCDILNAEVLCTGGGAMAAVARRPAGPDTPAYILYTSGSTGQPKGIVHSHYGLLHQVMRHTNALQIAADDRVTMLGSASAAQANTQLWVALLNGAALYPRNMKQAGLADLAEWLTQNSITYFRSSASVFRHWAAHLTRHTCPKLRLVVIGGEPVYRSDVDLHRSRFAAGCKLVNALSSTETGTVCMQVVDSETPLDGNVVPVGYTLDDVAVSLVDAAGARVAAGDVGEFVVTSRGLALGRWTRDGLEQSGFTSDAHDHRMRTLRMHDFGRQLPGGAFVQLGRRDTMVKISGYRVEVAEIEHALHRSELVRHAAVVSRDDESGESRLVAHVVPRAGVTPGAAQLRRHLEERLPEHMIPGRFELMEELPLTPSGKIDRLALQTLVSTPRTRSADPPGRLGILGEQLRVIWEDVLEARPIGVDDDFVELGGNSLLAMDMLLRVEKSCGRTVAPSRLLDGPLTIGRLVEHLMKDEDFGRPMTAIQSEGTGRPLFFLHGDHENGGFYCRELARLLGPKQRFYAITPHGLDGDALPWDMETMARDRIEIVRSVQATGPYRLGGFCTGGIVAFEMARQLQARGETVDTLLLIDSALDNAALSVRLLGRTMQTVGRRLHWDEATRRRRFLGLRPLIAAEHRNPMPWRRLRHVAERLRYLAMQPGMTPGRDQGVAEAHEARGAHLERHHDYGVRRRDYLPGRFHGRVALFRSDYLSGLPADAGWSRFVSAVDVHWLPGYHQSAVTRHVATLAAWMRPYLEPIGGTDSNR